MYSKRTFLTVVSRHAHDQYISILVGSQSASYSSQFRVSSRDLVNVNLLQSALWVVTSTKLAAERRP
jgi:hypothetical protein